MNCKWYYLKGEEQQLSQEGENHVEWLHCANCEVWWRIQHIVQYPRSMIYLKFSSWNSQEPGLFIWVHASSNFVHTVQRLITPPSLGGCKSSSTLLQSVCCFASVFRAKILEVRLKIFGAIAPSDRTERHHCQGLCKLNYLRQRATGNIANGSSKSPNNAGCGRYTWVINYINRFSALFKDGDTLLNYIFAQQCEISQFIAYFGTQLERKITHYHWGK